MFGGQTETSVGFGFELIPTRQIPASISFESTIPYSSTLRTERDTEKACSCETDCYKMDTPPKNVTQTENPVSKLKLEVYLLFVHPLFL